jgi:transposase
MRTGAPWRDLPEEFGNWNSIFRQFRRAMMCISPRIKAALRKEQP